MNISYLIYEAERPKTVAEQRTTDIQTGRLAANVARFGSSVKEAVIRAAVPRRTADRAPELTADVVASECTVRS